MKTKTLGELIVARRCRKGAAIGISPRGAYWHPAKPVTINRAGGDGVGNSACDLTMKLELRNYRSGLVEVVVRVESWHQNTSSRTRVVLNNDLRQVLQATTAEDVIATLLGLGDGHNGPLYSDRFEADLIAWLGGLGLPACLPAPDDVGFVLPA